MSEGSSSGYREGIFSAVSAGFFFVLIGVLFVITPNLLGKIIDFFRDFGVVQIPNLGVWFIAPEHPSLHSTVYLAVQQFSFIWAFFQIAILVLRFAAGSLFGKKAETVSNLVFWFGAGVLINMFLIETARLNVNRWFQFWAAIIMLLGLSLIVRGIILAAKPVKSAT